MSTLGDLIEENARRYSDLPAFSFEGRVLTHGAFHRRASQLADGLHRLGVRRQDRVAILSQNRLEYVEIYGACELAGFIASTVNFRLAPPEMRWILENASPSVLIFESGYAEVVEQLRPQLPGIAHFVVIDGDAAPGEGTLGYEELVALGEFDHVPFRSKPDDIAHLIHTSGTTGRPKGCIEDHRGVRAWAQSMAIAHLNGPAERELLMMPFFHVGAKYMQLAQHSVGGTVYLQRGFDVEAVLRCISEDEITIAHMAPIMVKALVESTSLGRYSLKSLKAIVYGAAPMPLPVLRRGLELMGPVFIQTYGQTETLGTTLARHQHRPDGDERDLRRLQSVGHPYPDAELRIVDEQGRDCGPEIAGEIVIRSSGRFRGYWNNTAATLETLRDGWVFTGDVGKRDADGFLYLVDRKKDMIISGGENIYSREVEDALLSSPAVSDCAVIGVPDEKWGEAVCAVVVLREGHERSEADLIAHCRERIAAYKRPRRVEFVDDLPRLPSGKVSKVELRQRYVG